MFSKIRSYCLYVIEHSSFVEEFPKLESVLISIEKDFLILKEEKKTSMKSYLDNLDLIIENCKFSLELVNEFKRFKDLLSYYKGCYIDFEK